MELPFSERVGVRPPRKIQTAGMDSELRNSIWNLLFAVFESEGWSGVAQQAAIGCLKVSVSSVPVSNQYFARVWLEKRIAALEWYQAYDLLEFVARHEALLRESGWTSARFMDAANRVLERELSGFRFVRGALTRLTGEQEVQAIAEAAGTAGRVGLGGVETHLDEALRMLGLRPTPDYRNSVKESISAIESAVKSISGVEGGGLDKALDVLAKKTQMHPGLRAGLLSLYGYTSDEDGVRHAILEQPNVGYDEAKLMLVNCAALTHFLISKAGAAGLLKT